MSFFFKNIKADANSEDDDNLNVQEDELEQILRNKKKFQHAEEDNDSSDDSDDGLKSISFGSIKSASEKLDKEERKERKNKKIKKRKRKVESDHEEDLVDFAEEEAKKNKFKEGRFNEEESSSDDDGTFFEEDDEEEENKRKKKRKAHKHAPKEESFKKKVHRIRDIPGLPSIYQTPKRVEDIRFDKSIGKSEHDMDIIRRRYKFLDEYREKELHDMEAILNDQKLVNKMDSEEVRRIEDTMRSMSSRLESVKNRDLERKIIKDYENEHFNNKNSKNKFYLKKTEKRKIINKWKFDNMKANQREKVMERKRKKQLGKEYKQFAFHRD
ncbi:hypothetical protein TBLA_0D01020 [Henningerozyma blattae CBS 6284]|uniref:rRNA biogenesis protein RRP36 n=1 Tax=Henningerozyma blattae (strain ATCC 34711 / CBS 6284 / DSM 70876 / NBRC 10599 / NRRL Y-10934 / UCD 77-7) TaxID=1071380 RepID=I2H2K8_HENB6|nr:hypothetical protein TBLA_0D01020 [Tetrapisispora blattae CBS 6284]CCH60610.1 hypothetical protein TBLA_0D01020 [Tetrapisispora blattae CBS 6284]